MVGENDMSCKTNAFLCDMLFSIVAMAKAI